MAPAKRQHPELKMVALVRHGRQQRQIVCVGFQRFGQLVVLGLAQLGAALPGAQMMGLVKYHQAPARRGPQALDAGRVFDGVDAGDQPVVPGKSVGLAVGVSPSAPKTSKPRLGVTRSTPKRIDVVSPHRDHLRDINAERWRRFGCTSPLFKGLASLLRRKPTCFIVWCRLENCLRVTRVRTTFLSQLYARRLVYLCGFLIAIRHPTVQSW